MTRPDQMQTPDLADVLEPVKGAARLVLEAETPEWPKHNAENYYELMAERERIIAAREAMRDEVAMARVLARRGSQPEPEWRKEADDPRLEAWREVHSEAIEKSIKSLEESVKAQDFIGIAQKSMALADHARACAGVPSVSSAP